MASASFFDGHVNWYENLDEEGYEWKNHSVYVGMQGYYILVGGVDGDGDEELVVAISWIQYPPSAMHCL